MSQGTSRTADTGRTLDAERASPAVRGAPGTGGPRVIWLNVPEELQHIFEPYLLQALPFLPRWVVELRIKWDADDGDSGLRSSVSPEYRTGWVIICPSWFGAADDYRRAAVRHELAHFALDPIWRFARDLIPKLTADEAFTCHLREQLRQAIEMSTCDVEEMLGVALGHLDRRLTDRG
jgi:hypothetical protein